MSNRIKECIVSLRSKLLEVTRVLDALDQEVQQLDRQVDERVSQVSGGSMTFGNMSPIRSISPPKPLPLQLEPGRKRKSTAVTVYSDTEFNDGRGTAWSPTLDKKLEECVHIGLSWAQIAPIVGRTEAACQGRYRKLESMPTTSYDLWSEEQDLLLVEGQANGLSWNEVAQFVGGRTAKACSSRWGKLRKEHKLPTA